MRVSTLPKKEKRKSQGGDATTRLQIDTSCKEVHKTWVRVRNVGKEKKMINGRKLERRSFNLVQTDCVSEVEVDSSISGKGEARMRFWERRIGFTLLVREFIEKGWEGSLRYERLKRRAPHKSRK